MLTLKYEKSGAMRFISHIDILRHFAKIMRRANIEVGFSKGFNPHMLLFFSPPLTLGISSIAEYVTVDTKIDSKEFLEVYNLAAPDGIKATRVFEVAKDPKLHGIVTCADYIMPFNFSDVRIGQRFDLTLEKKGATVTENVVDKIFDVFEQNGKMVMRLALGNINLRADKVAIALAEKLNVKPDILSIVKTAQYVETNDGQKNVDDYLASFGC